MAQAAARMDESALIRAAQSGDEHAFEQLVRLYDQSVLRLALNLLRSPEDANDVYQEAFLRVYKNLHSFRFDCSFRFVKPVRGVEAIIEACVNKI